MDKELWIIQFQFVGKHSSEWLTYGVEFTPLEANNAKLEAEQRGSKTRLLHYIFDRLEEGNAHE